MWLLLKNDNSRWQTMTLMNVDSSSKWVITLCFLFCAYSFPGDRCHDNILVLHYCIPYVFIFLSIGIENTFSRRDNKKYLFNNHYFQMVYLIPNNDYSKLFLPRKIAGGTWTCFFVVLIYECKDDSISVTNVYLYYIPWSLFQVYTV